MNIKRILCPVDFSEYNRAANDYASMLAKSTGASITYIHAYLPDVYQAPPVYFDASQTEQELSEKLTDFIKPNSDNITHSYVVEFGTPSDQIVDYAKKNDIDLIIMGTHGRSGVMRVLMGSIAEAVVRKAECPVLAIKPETEVTASA